ncbi:MAG: YaiI/YqxD family protein [Lentisphaerota bacterium]
MRIFVDADAFPSSLREILFKAAERLKLPLIMVANTHIRLPESKYISNIHVKSGPDVADDYIAQELEKGDLVITADIPLAYRVVIKGGFAINPRGELYNETNINQKLAMRDLMDELRNEGLMTGGPAPFKPKDRQTFANALTKFLDKSQTSINSRTASSLKTV